MTVQEAKERLIEKLCHEKEPHKFCRDACMYGDEHCEVQVAIKCMEEVEQYRALGTVEELKEAREKQVAKKPIHKEFELGNYYECPICGDITLRDYCGKCGQALKWGEEDE
jgi:hypothetical protein